MCRPLASSIDSFIYQVKVQMEKSLEFNPGGRGRSRGASYGDEARLQLRLIEGQNFECELRSLGLLVVKKGRFGIEEVVVSTSEWSPRKRRRRKSLDGRLATKVKGEIPRFRLP
jgi:hypothetical protein